MPQNESDLTASLGDSFQFTSYLAQIILAFLYLNLMKLHMHGCVMECKGPEVKNENETYGGAWGRVKWLCRLP